MLSTFKFTLPVRARTDGRCSGGFTPEATGDTLRANTQELSALPRAPGGFSAGRGGGEWQRRTSSPPAARRCYSAASRPAAAGAGIVQPAQGSSSLPKGFAISEQISAQFKRLRTIAGRLPQAQRFGRRPMRAVGDSGPYS